MKTMKKSGVRLHECRFYGFAETKCLCNCCLEGDTQHLLEKNQAIQSFLPILLSILKSKSELIPGFQQQLNPRLEMMLLHRNISLQAAVFGACPQGAASADEIESTLSRSNYYLHEHYSNDRGRLLQTYLKADYHLHLLQVNTDFH